MPKPPELTMKEYALVARCVKLHEAATAARDFLLERFGHANAQHDPEAIHALAKLNLALDAK